jgi:hypothetical protein
MKKILPLILAFTIFFVLLFTKANPVFAEVIEEESCSYSSLDLDSRPAACYVCSQTDLLTPSCATSFEVLDEISYPRNGPETITKTWGGTVTIAPETLTIPFVGKETFESEQNNLADYFEGTNEYYKNYGNLTTLTNYQGILRKLTPLGYQDQLKQQMVERAGNEEINDYPVRYIGRLCWDFPFWADAVLFFMDKLGLESPDVTHFCLYEDLINHPGSWFMIKGYRFFSWLESIIPLPGGKDFKDFTDWLADSPGMIHYSYTEGVEATSLSTLISPPDPSGLSPQEYQEQLLNWKYDENGNLRDNYKLWLATPMLSREDTPGQIDPYFAKKDSRDEFLPEEPQTEAVPHLARLYEGSKIISDLLTPVWDGEKTIEMVKTPEIPETNPPYACLPENYLPGNEGDTLCCEPIEGTLNAVEEFPNPFYEECHQGLNALATKCASLNLLNSTPTKILDCYNDLAALISKCNEGEPKDVSRDFGINLKHPYLDEIWSFTTNANGGFFNIFRPYGFPTFEDIPAAQTIAYGYPGGVSPGGGLFFFPHLGGIQIAKEWVVNKVLWPFCDETISPCPKIPEI